MIGIQWGTPNATKTQIKSTNGRKTYTGKVSKPGVVKLWVDNKVAMIQDSKQNSEPDSFQFEEIEFQPGLTHSVKIVDAEENLLFEEEVPYYKSLLQKNENAYSMFIGRTPVQFRSPGLYQQLNTLKLKGETGFILPHSNKWLVGGRYFHGFSERLTGGLSAASDTIIGQPQSSYQFQLRNQYSNANLLGTVSRFRNPNFYTGTTIGAEIHYRLGDDWVLSSNLALSRLRSFDTNAPQDGFGRAASLDLEKSDYSGSSLVKLFYYDSNFYSPSTSFDYGTFDRYGVELCRKGQLKGFSYFVDWQKYKMNLDGASQEGLVNGENWTLSLGRRISRYTQFQLSLNRRQGFNDNRKSMMENDYFSLSQDLPLGMNLNLNFRRTNYATYYNAYEQDGLSLLPIAQNAIQKYLTANLNIPVHRIGSLSMGVTAGQQYNLYSLAGSFRWKGLEFSPQIQKSFRGTQSLNTLGLGLYYYWDNQRKFGVRYLYTESNFPSLSSLLGGGVQSVNHNFQFDFNDMLALIGNRLVSVGPRGESTGILDCLVYLDRNQNGLQDADEPPVPGIPLTVDKDRKFKSGKAGRLLLPQLSPGSHAVDFNYDELPLTLTPTTHKLAAQVEQSKRTRAAFGVLLTPGTLSGQVQVKDGKGNPVSASEIIISLLDKKSGKEFRFTYVDSQGNFSLSEVPPGQYQLQIDPRYLEQNHLKVFSKPYEVEVPLMLNDFYDRKELNFNVLQLLRS